jgi:hypothetical protein
LQVFAKRTFLAIVKICGTDLKIINLAEKFSCPLATLTLHVYFGTLRNHRE